MRNLIVIAITLFTVLAHSKSFYMTVRRDYSSKEDAEVEVNYLSTSSLTVRVLKPKDQNAFIASQVDLRRAWREPKSLFNPIHFMVNGEEEANLSTDWLRNGVAADVRKALTPNVGGAYKDPGSYKFFPGPEKVIALPAGFDLVKEISVEPEDADKNRPFDVPGFNYYFVGRSELKTKTIKLPKLNPGFYVVQFVQGRVEGQVVVVVNELLAQMQQSSDQVIYRVANRQGTPVSGASVEVRNLAGKWISKGKTDDKGEYIAKGLKDTDLITVVKSAKGGTAIVDSEFFSTTSTFADLYLFTDRPMYKAADTVKFRGILRKFEKGLSNTPGKKPKTVKVELQNLDGSSVGKSVSVPVGEFGTFNGTLKLDTEEGVYRVTAKVASEGDHSGEIRVKEYVKPLFFVTITTKRETLKAGDTLEAKLKAERYAGGAPKIVEVNAALYRVRMAAPQWVDDAGMGETGSATTYGGDDSEKGKGSMQPQYIANIEKIEFNDAGEAEFKFKVPEIKDEKTNYDYQYQLLFTFVDADSNTVNTSKNLLDLNSEVVTQVRFNKTVIKNADEAKLEVHTVTPSGKPFGNSKGQVEFSILTADGKTSKLETKEVTSDGNGIARVALPSTLSVGELTAKATFADSAKQTSTMDASVLVAGKEDGAAILNVPEAQLYSNQYTVTPAEKATLFVLLPKAWGENGENAGTVFITLAGDKIHSRRSLAIKGNSFWIEEPIKPEYGTGLHVILSYAGNKGWTERRSSFRIVDAGKSLKVAAKAQFEMTAPGGKQSLDIKVTDSDGKPMKAEVSISVVDKSVLDLQPEIRPRLMDFFYPLSKLNLMTFYSTQFQGYGYGEEIARLFGANYNLAAAKSQSKALDQADTAYWKADIVTDANGNAKVDFNLPGNQTIWRVTSIAVDNSGRFGESTSEFKAQMPVTLLLGYAPFLRKGDKSQVRVNLTSAQATEKTAVKYELKPEGSELIKIDKSLSVDQTLKPKEQASFSMPITAARTDSPKTVAFMGRLNFSGSDLRFKDEIKVLPGDTLVPEYYYLQANQMKVPLQKEHHIATAELQIGSGLTAAIIPAMTWLIHYPYGCVEQTVSTTVPNLVLSNWLKGLEKKGVKLTASETELQKKASEFGAAGVARLRGFRGSDGGFKWFQGEKESDPNMTLMVMTVLASVPGSEVEFYQFSDTLAYLKKQNYKAASPEGVFVSFIEARMDKAGATYLNENTVNANLVVQLIYVKKEGSLMEKALLLSAMANYRAAKKMEIERTALAEIVAKEAKPIISSQTTFDKIRWSPSTSGWQAYPGRWTSTISAVAAALRVGGPAQFQTVKSELRWNLMHQFNGENFGSTWDTAHSLLAALDLVEDEVDLMKKDFVKDQVVLKINGKTKDLAKLKTEDGLSGLRVVLPTSDFEIGDNTVTVDSKKNPLVRLAVNKAIPNSEVPSQNRGWALARQYFKLSEKGEKKEIDPANTTLKVGDLVYAEIKFMRGNTNKPWYASRYYVLTEGIPAGMTVIQEDAVYRSEPFSLPLNGRARTREIMNDQIRWYYDFTHGWMDRDIVLGYVMRANYPGQFDSGVTKIEDFYDASQTSMVAATRFKIESAK